MSIGKISLMLTGVLLLASCAHISASQQKDMANFDNASLISVYDGDTFYIDIPSCDIDIFCKHISVRVRGVDCPEMKGGTAKTKARAKQAKEFSERFLKSGKILLYNCGRDKYFRLLCDVEVNGQSLGEELLKAGHAIPYDGGTKKSFSQAKHQSPI